MVVDLDYLGVVPYVNDGGLICKAEGGGYVSEARINGDLEYLETYEKEGQKFKTAGKVVKRWHNNVNYRCWRNAIKTGR